MFGNDETFQLLMNIITGTVVAIMTIAIPVGILLMENRRKKDA